MSIVSQFGKTLLYLFFKKYRLVSGVIAAIILLIGTLAFLAPKYQTVRNQGLLTSGNKKKTLTQRQAYLERLQKMINVYRGIQKTDLDKLQQILPDSQEIPELYVMIDQLGKELSDDGVQAVVKRIALTPQPLATTNTGAQPGDIENNRQGGIVSDILTPITGPSSAVASSPIRTFQLGKINVIVELGVTELTYTAYKKILEKVEKNMRLFDIVSVNYVPDNETVTLNLETYYLATS